VKENKRYAAIHTDSKITLDATSKPRNHQNLIEQIRDGIRDVEKDNWTIHFTWVKAHNNNLGNGLADQLAKKAANSGEETAYNKIPKSAITKEIQAEGEQEWQKELDASTKGAITKTFFPTIADRK
jgi:ribonuclease HI